MEGEAGRDPTVPGLPTADIYGAMAAVTSVLGALLRREREGQGCWIDLAISDVIGGVGAPLHCERRKDRHIDHVPPQLPRPEMLYGIRQRRRLHWN